MNKYAGGGLIMHITRKVFEKIEISEEDAKKITINYLENTVIGEGCHINNKGKIIHWTSWPHGSGTTTTIGAATKIQVAAQELLTELVEP